LECVKLNPGNRLEAVAVVGEAPFALQGFLGSRHLATEESVLQLGGWGHERDRARGPALATPGNVGGERTAVAGCDRISIHVPVANEEEPYAPAVDPIVVL
jgi:hypothetical protein